MIIVRVKRSVSSKHCTLCGVMMRWSDVVIVCEYCARSGNGKDGIVVILGNSWYRVDICGLGETDKLIDR